MSLINARFTKFPRRRKYGVALGVELPDVTQRYREGTRQVRVWTGLARPTPRFELEMSGLPRCFQPNAAGLECPDRL